MMITYIGILQTPSNKNTWINHGSIWEIMYCLEGSGSLLTGAKEIPFGPGDVILQPPDLSHKFSRSTSARILYIMVDGEYPFGNLLSFSDTEDKDVHSLAMVLYRLYAAHDEVKRQIVELHLLSALIEYISMITTRSQHSQMVEVMETAILENLSVSTFRIQDMYRQLYLPEDKARAQFESEIGCTPHKYLSRLRIQRACWHLLHSPGDISIAEIASRVGVADPQYFSRIFKQHTGLSPSDWMKQNMPKE